MVMKFAIFFFNILHVGFSYAGPEANIKFNGKNSADPGLPLYYFDTSAYYFQKFFKATQQEGELFCKNLKMELVDVESKKENDFLFDTIASLVDYESTDFWTCGVLSGNIWYWTSKGHPFSYTNWRSSSGSGDCLGIQYDSSLITMSWFKSNCTEAKYVICEGEGRPSNDTTITVPTNPSEDEAS